MTDGEVDVFDREREFIDRVLARIVERVPGLKVVGPIFRTLQS